MSVDSNSALLSRFLREEASPYVRGLLRNSVADGSADRRIAIREFNFNAFDITLDFQKGLVIVADVLDPTSEVTIPLSEFIAVIAQDDPDVQ